ncbi:MAG: hypothetical protein DI573_06575 [Microbacterium sp.]|uniref:hypothetical protein n=1 Tax=unclassified Microbacterium TaxID=2609290 RepID=UPI000DB28900|nr:hypothetical protein [Microbacterium sp.]PZU39605.1 MAG: hypothetical protein DI573_06575 [Microbacterium sp.]
MTPPTAAAPDSFLLAADERRMPIGMYGRVRSRELIRVRPGVYAPTAWWRGLEPHARYVERVKAAALVFPGSAFMRESAAALHGLPIFGDPAFIHLFDPSRRSTRTFGDVVVHALTGHREVIRLDGRLVTDLVSTVVDTSRYLTPAYALAVIDASLRRGMNTTDLHDWSAADPDRRNERMLAWAWEFADGRAESSGESVSRAVISWLGFPVPVLQQVFSAEGVDDRSDFWWPTYRAIGESDGYGKYRAETAEEAVRKIVREKVREDRLRRQSDGFARWDWRDAHRVTLLEKKLRHAGLPQVMPRDRAMLATIRPLR